MSELEELRAEVERLRAILGDSRCSDVPALVRSWTDMSAEVIQLRQALQEIVGVLTPGICDCVKHDRNCGMSDEWFNALDIARDALVGEETAEEVRSAFDAGTKGVTQCPSCRDAHASPAGMWRCGSCGRTIPPLASGAA